MKIKKNRILIKNPPLLSPLGGLLYHVFCQKCADCLKDDVPRAVHTTPFEGDRCRTCQSAYAQGNSII